MPEDIPIVILDWDYDTFSLEGTNRFHLYDETILEKKPEYVYIEGWPAPGNQMTRALAKRVEGEFSCYQLV